MKNINNDINNSTFKHFYLLSGEEDYLKKQYRDKLVAALVSPDDNMNLTFFDGKKTDINEVMEIANTMPFFAERRVIVAENTGWFDSTPDELRPGLETLPETAYLIFLEKKINKGSKGCRFIKKEGYLAELNMPAGKELSLWIGNLCAEQGKSIDARTVSYFLENINSDMLLIKNELEKLFAYVGDKDKITIDDIREVCISQANEKMFDMLDAIGAHNHEKALMYYRDMLALQHPSMSILFMLTRHYRILMQMKKCVEEGKGRDDIKRIFSAEPWRLMDFAIRNYMNQIAGYTYKELYEMVEQCQMTEQQIKTGNVQDVVGVELLIVDFSRA